MFTTTTLQYTVSDGECRANESRAESSLVACTYRRLTGFEYAFEPEQFDDDDEIMKFQDHLDLRAR